MARRVTVISAWQASYPDPITVKAGEALRLTGRTGEWDGYRWLWAMGPDGREGWIPDRLARPEHGRVVAGFDYSAAELSCAPGEILTSIEESHGWQWCRSASGESGWVPSRNLAPA